MIAYIFPGQGSQVKGMGGELFQQFKGLTQKADAILGYSVESLCLQDPDHLLHQTQYTQPALYVVNALSYLYEKSLSPVFPDYFAGHSLGEYSALFAAGAFDFETGLQLVKKRGELMSRAQDGAMAAIIGLKKEDIECLPVEIANYNSHSQFVISGVKKEIVDAMALCEAAGAKMVVPLNVSGAFHSSQMKQAQKEFEAFLESFPFSLPTAPVISNVTAKPYKINEIKKNLFQQISSPVRWTETIEYLMSQEIIDFKEIGPGAVLSGLVKRIQVGQ